MKFRVLRENALAEIEKRSIAISFRQSYHPLMTTFAEVVERADSLSQDEREDLIRILQARLREERRAEILEDVKMGEAAFKAGKCKVMTPAQIMRRLRK
jgi:hypothetical protein